MTHGELWLATALLLVIGPLDARRRLIAARHELEAAESIPLSGMGGYRAARIVGAERALERAETRESGLDAPDE